MTPQELSKYGIELVSSGGRKYLYERGGTGTTAGFREITGPVTDTSFQFKEIAPQDWEMSRLAQMGYQGAGTSKANIGWDGVQSLLGQYQQRESALAPTTGQNVAMSNPAGATTQWQLNMANNQTQTTPPQNPTVSAQAQPMQPPTQTGSQVAPFGMSDRFVLNNQGQWVEKSQTQQPTQQIQPTSTTRSFAGLTPQQVAELDAASLRGTPTDLQNIKYATQRFGYVPPTDTQGAPITPTQTTIRSFPGLTPEQVAQLDAATMRGTATDIANIQYANQRYGYTPPTISGTKTPMTPPPTSTATPTVQQKSYLDTLREQLDTLSKPSGEEQNLQKMIDDLITSRDMGINTIADQPIAMPFITGQAASVQRQAQQQLDTLERKLARLQADREAKRQAALETASIEERKMAQEQARIEKEEAKKAAEEKQAFLEKQALQEQVFSLIEKGYTPLSGPASLVGLREDQLLRLPSSNMVLKKPDIIASTSIGKKSTGGGPSTFSTGITTITTPGGGTKDVRLSTTAQAVYDNPALLNNFTPTERGKIIKELAAAGVDMQNLTLEKVNAGQREQIADYDTIMREAMRARDILDSGLDVGPVASRIKSAQAVIGGAPEFTEYNSVISNMNSILVRARSGAAVTPQEFDRIKGFIPSPNDDEKTAKKKIERFMEEMEIAKNNYIERSTQTSQQLLQSTTNQSTSNDPLGLR